MGAVAGGPPEGRYVDAGVMEGVPITLHFHEKGAENKDAPAVVFVHGSGPGASGYSNFKQNYEVFAQAGYRAILPDLIGYGYSTKPEDVDYTLEHFAGTLKAALDNLGVEKCTLVGNSLGGAIAIRIALDYPEFVEKLILMAPGGIEELDTYFAMPGIQAMMSGFMDGTLDEAGLGKLLEQLVFDPKHVTPELVRERLAILEMMPQAVLGRMRVPNQDHELGDLQCPVLGFWGTEDRFCPASGAQKILEACRPARFVMVNECGHWVMVEHARLFNQACLDFLAHD